MKVRWAFQGQGPFPMYVLPSSAPTPMPLTTPYASTWNIPRASPRVRRRPEAHTVKTGAAHPSPPMSPGTPNTPEQSYSTSTSPASSTSPSTPPGFVDTNVCIASHSTHGMPHTIVQDPIVVVVPPPLQKVVSKSPSRSSM